MPQSQLKAAVTLIKVTSTPPQEDAVNPGKGGTHPGRTAGAKRKPINRGDMVSGINGGALPKAMLNWGWGGAPRPRRAEGPEAGAQSQ